MEDNKKRQKNAEKNICYYCNFKCCKKSDWVRHISRPKHKKKENDNKNDTNDNKKTPNDLSCLYKCECGNIYKYQSGLLRHKRSENCKKNADFEHFYNVGEIKTLTNLVLEVVKQNQELTNKIVEMSGNMNSNILINNHSNNNNKTFNLNMFLNETCKDAMNITDFVDSLQLQLSDLENVGKLGFVEGISNIIVKNLKAMDVHKRPVHCPDKKREVIYIKDEDKWEKENEQKQHLRKAIKRVAFKNEKLLPKYKELHPGCNYSDSKYSDYYSKLVIEAMGGSGNNELEKQDKIIKNIAKEVIIDKT
jgi:hypothetical protein